MAAETIRKTAIPLSRPFIDKGFHEELERVLAAGKLSGDGRVCKEVEEILKTQFGLRHALLTTSCTHALEMAMRLLNLKPGDEVILPSFTFVSTANAILLAGGKPVFCEINDETLTVDIGDLEKRISGKTKAIIPVHYAGVSAGMDEVLSVAKGKSLTVVEDAAQGVNARYKGRALGGIGAMGAYSFHDTKNYVSGEGGALVTNDEGFARRAEVFREKGTNRANFIRGEVDKYTWVDIGSSYILSEILAALLKSQLASLDSIQQRRRHIHERYMLELADLERKEKLRLPVIPVHCDSNYHLFYILLRDEQERDRVMKEMKVRGIGATFHYVPLHSAPYARKNLGTSGIQLPVTDRIAGTLLRLPLFPQLQDEEVDYIIEQLTEVLSS